MPNVGPTTSSSSQPALLLTGSYATELQSAKPILLPKGKGAINFTAPVDTLEVQVSQQTLLPCLKERIASDILSLNKDAYKKANWKPIVQFARDLETDLDNMLRRPDLLVKLDAESIPTLIETLTKIGEGLTWLEGKRRNWFKDLFAPFFTGYESEVKAFETSYARLNTALGALNAVYQQKKACAQH